MPGKASSRQKLAPIPMDRQLPDSDLSTSGRVKGWSFTLGQTFNPSLADIFKIKVDDDDSSIPPIYMLESFVVQSNSVNWKSVK